MISATSIAAIQLKRRVTIQQNHERNGRIDDLTFLTQHNHERNFNLMEEKEGPSPVYSGNENEGPLRFILSQSTLD